ncbi:uncharacterized protein BDR25DRAFT_61256 [Lindgomyces ingoldianus]|uniref:Uncharacterized protein n=1 Tax=Lindgomyces ingoldianus TaxID=673940 RepID=A0ACB6QL30_9PLEO|nr:uncharacterized protein BDR25DRAFT_61256 [Lindgomyces ingoldianus]KAF2467610.1 hypothetical protein BDR25DRAFT_61256 [Lindgomyces ingoldianus]
MGGPSYTVEQLQHLRSSPLVQKPDGLPSIEQWMEPPADQNNNTTTNRRPRSGVLREGDAPLSSENRSDRPLFTNAGMGNFGRRASTQPEDTVLGPPKLSFTSASRNAKASENTEKRAATALDGDQLGDRFSARERWTRGERDGERTRDKAGFTNGRRNAREDGEGWTNVKSRKSLGQDDFDRGFGRNGDRDREKGQKEGDTDNNDSTVRRPGAGREKLESRWGRREDSGAKEGDGNRFGTSGQGGWRDRERDRDRDRDRDWNRGGSKLEEDPEWMDTKVGSEKKQAKTQEDFQRWKEQMRAKDAPAEEKEEIKDPLPPNFEQSSFEPSIRTTFAAAPPKQVTPLGLDPSQDRFFGNWGKEKTPEASVPEPAATIKKSKAKSRFTDMFTKPEESAKPPPLPTPASPTQGGANGNNEEDKEGFQRILQMLGGASIGVPQSSQPPTTAPLNGARQGGISIDLPYQSQTEEPPEMRHPPRQQVPRTVEQQAMLENILAPRPSAPETRLSQGRFNAMSPESALIEQFGLPRPESNHPADEFPMQQPPPRNSSAQDAHLHALLNSRAREETSRDQAKQQFLLNLMHSRTPPQLMNQNLPRPTPENQNLPSFFDQPTQRPQGQPKGRGAPPGFMDDPRLFADNEMLMRREVERREAERREAANFREIQEARNREQIMREAGLQQQQEAMRKNNPRLPSMPYDDPSLAGLQRRNTAGEIPRQMTNMGIPSQPIPDMPYMRGNPGMAPTPQDRNIAPPPGFGAPVGMRQPPGFVGPQGGPPPQMGPSFSAGNTPLGHPPGIPPPRGMGGMFPGQPQNQMPPPQSYFPPLPGYGPPMGMRGAEDPRMMMGGRPEFEGFGAAGPGPGQQGGPRQAGRPPPGMY